MGETPTSMTIIRSQQFTAERAYKEGGQEQSSLLNVGDIFYASVGTEHVAHPVGEARILVVEAEGSV